MEGALHACILLELQPGVGTERVDGAGSSTKRATTACLVHLSTPLVLIQRSISCRARSRVCCCWAEEGQEEELVNALVASAVGSKEGQEVSYVRPAHCAPCTRPKPSFGSSVMWSAGILDRRRRHAWIEGGGGGSGGGEKHRRARAIPREEEQEKGLKDA